MLGSICARARAFALRYRHAATILALLLSPLAAGPADAQVVERLYAGPAPGSEHWARPEEARLTPDGGTTYFNVRDPTLTAFVPDQRRATGAAVVLLPGGALRLLSVDHNMLGLAKRLTDAGVAVFILKYRVLQGAVPPEPARPAGVAPHFPTMEIRHANANPSPQDPALSEVLRLGITDVRQAIAMLRRQAKRWHIDPARVGLIGASAGGGIAIDTTLVGSPAEQPSFVASLFGPSLMDVTVPASAPPLFLATEAGHGPVTDGLIALFSEWNRAGKSAELHIYDVPVFNFANSVWLPAFSGWADRLKLLQGPEASSPRLGAVRAMRPDRPEARSCPLASHSEGRRACARSQATQARRD